MDVFLLLGYLPTMKLEQENNKTKQKCLMTNLYHACLRHILDPLLTAGNSGVFMSTATSNVHQVHPILTSFIGNYPEQVLSTCTLTGDCPRCDTPTANLGDFNPNNVPAPHNHSNFINALNSFHWNSTGFLKAALQIRSKPVPHPFWLEHPRFNIFYSITPNILHQLYQGIIKYLKAWILCACKPTEIDARCHCLPPNHNIHLFTKGISSLSQVTGHEHDQICCFLLGIIIDIHLPHNCSNIQFICSAWALLDFLYLTQYPIHSSSMLQLLMDALAQFHANCDIFIALGIWTQFNLPKLHFMSHYVELIKHLGTANNFNT